MFKSEYPSTQLRKKYSETTRRIIWGHQKSFPSKLHFAQAKNANKNVEFSRLLTTYHKVIITNRLEKRNSIRQFLSGWSWLAIERQKKLIKMLHLIIFTSEKDFFFGKSSYWVKRVYLAIHSEIFRTGKKLFLLPHFFEISFPFHLCQCQKVNLGPDCVDDRIMLETICNKSCP